MTKDMYRNDFDYPANDFFPQLYEYNSRPPKDKNEFFLWLKIKTHLYFRKSKLVELLKAIFQGGITSDDESIFEFDGIQVVLKEYYDYKIETDMLIGGWIDTEKLIYGNDIEGLIIYYRRYSYDNVMAMLSAKAIKITNNMDIRDNQSDKTQGYVQEAEPVFVPYLPSFPIPGCKIKDRYVYETIYGKSFQVVSDYNLPNGDSCNATFILTRHYNSQRVMWQMLLPQPPYRMYNLQLIYNNPDARIDFVANETIADESPKYNSDIVFTTCYGGLKNILEANLYYFSGRRLLIHSDLKTQDIQILPEIIKRLEAHNVREINITFDSGKTQITDKEFMKDPAKWGCNSVTETGIKLKNKYRIISAGKKADGEEKETKILLNPIIEDGNIIWIFGEAKSFKSWIGYKLAYALSIGNQTVGRWNSRDEVKVLYIDGEMRPNKIKRRLDLIKKGMDYEAEERPFDLYIVKDSSGDNIDTDILSEEWQNEMESVFNRIDVIVFDNFYSLTDNTQKSVKTAISWFAKLTQAGKTVVVLDHSNRDGDVQGSISKERAADLVIKIEPHKTIKNRVTVSMPKPRDLHPNDTESFDLLMVFKNGMFSMEIVDGDNENGKPLSDSNLKKALAQELSNERGVSREDILKMLQIKQSTYYKYLKKELPRLTEQQIIQVKSKADRLLEMLN